MDERRPRVAGHRVHEQAGRLVDHHQPAVLVEHRNIDVDGLQVERGRLRFGECDRRPLDEAKAFRPPVAVDQHLAGLDQPFRPRPGAHLVGRGQEAVEPHPRLLRRHQPVMNRPSRRAAPRPPFQPGKPDQEQDHSGDDEGVCEVERRPVADVDEVDDIAEPQPVGEVADRPADQQAQRDREQGMPRPGTGEVDEHPGHRHGGQERDHLEPAGEDAEGDAVVADMADREEREQLQALAQGHVGDDQMLRHLVGGDGRGRHRDHPDPLERAGPLGLRLRIGQLLDQPRSSSLLHSMHFVACGNASSRASSIGSPHRSQMP